MKTAMSSACFYQLETENAIAECGKIGFKTIEIFVNSDSEMRTPLFGEIKNTVDFYGLDVCTVHPYTSFAETFCLFGTYKRRFQDTVEYYKSYYDFAARLGAKNLVLHGCLDKAEIEDEDYFERYAILAQVGEAFGVKLSQENVVNHKSQSIDFMKKLNDYIGEDFSMILDIKQCRRAGENPNEFVKLFGNKISHIHISDYNNACDCLPPFEGEFNFSQLITNLKSCGFNGEYIIELYRRNFINGEQIKLAAEKLDKIM